MSTITSLQNLEFISEMDYLRHSARILRMDRIRNETIRTKMGLKKDMLQETEQQQLRWYGHIMGMEGCKIARQVAEWNPKGNRRHSRPVNTWKDEIRDSVQRWNLKDEECFDRELRRKKIMSLSWGKSCTHKYINIYVYNVTSCDSIISKVTGLFIQDFPQIMLSTQGVVDSDC
jgi:hypothetical protein